MTYQNISEQFFIKLKNKDKIEGINDDSRDTIKRFNSVYEFLINNEYGFTNASMIEV